VDKLEKYLFWVMSSFAIMSLTLPGGC